MTIEVNGEIVRLEADAVADATTQQLVDMAADARRSALAANETASMLENEIMRRMLAEGAVQLAHPDYEKIALEPKVNVDVRIDVLRELILLAKAGKCPVKIVEKAIWSETPAEQWCTNMTYLKQLAKFGGRVAEVIAAGVVRQENGVRLVMKPKRSPVVHIPEGPS